MDNQDPNLDTGMQDPQNPDEELELDLEEGEQVTPPQNAGDGGRKRFEEMEKDELLNVVKRQHGQLKKLKGPRQPQPNLPIKPKDDEENVRDAGTRLSALELAERKRQYAWENGLSPEETDAVFRINSNPNKDTLLDPFIKGGLQAIRVKRRVENATPSTSNGSAVVNGKSFAEMTPEERAKNFDKVRANFPKK